MKILKHSKLNNYYFFNEADVEYIEAINLEPLNSLIISENTYSAKKFKKNFNKLLAKGYEEFEVPVFIEKMVDDFIETFEVNKPYYFIEKNEKDFYSSNLLSLKLIKSESGEYYFHVFDEQQPKLTCVYHYLASDLYGEGYELWLANIIPSLSFNSTMFFVLGYERISTDALVSLITGRNISNETLFSGKVYKHKEKITSSELDRFVKVSPNKERFCIRLDNFEVSENSIVNHTVDYKVAMSASEFDSVHARAMAEYDNNESYDTPLSEDDFFARYKLELKDNVFKLPSKVEARLRKLPLEPPGELIPIKKFDKSIIEENKIYFFANQDNEDPLEWDIAFLICVDLNEGEYLDSGVFPLKNFNKVINKVDVSTYKRHSELQGLVSDNKKIYKKSNLTAVSSTMIFEILSATPIQQLQNQALICHFVSGDCYERLVYDVYQNYVCVRSTSNIYIRWQFFQNNEQLDVWLKANKTTETELLPDMVKSLEAHTQHYLDHRDARDVKIQLISNPLLRNLFASPLGFLVELYKSTLKVEGQRVVDTDYKVTLSNSLCIDGDLNVNGTLYFDVDQSLSTFATIFIVVKGNLKAKNLIINSHSFVVLVVEKSICIDNIATATQKILCANAITNILLHNKKSILEVDTPFLYKAELSSFSPNIIEDTVLKLNYADVPEFVENNLYEYLISDEPFTSGDIESQDIDYDEHYKVIFENTMTNWGDYYCQFAGCEILNLSNDKEVKGGGVLVEAGDWVVNDTRSWTGTYGYSHEDASIYPVTIKKPHKYNVDYSRVPITLKVDAQTLMERYQWIAMLFIDWEHVLKVSPFSIFKDNADVENCYESEKESFAHDPHLALYWLLHFGFSLDTRYDEVKELIVTNKLQDQLEEIKHALSFFKKTTATYNMVISDDLALKDHFLKRRNYLFARTRSS